MLIVMILVLMIVKDDGREVVDYENDENNDYDVIVIITIIILVIIKLMLTMKIKTTEM